MVLYEVNDKGCITVDNENILKLYTPIQYEQLKKDFPEIISDPIIKKILANKANIENWKLLQIQVNEERKRYLQEIDAEPTTLSLQEQLDLQAELIEAILLGEV